MVSLRTGGSCSDTAIEVRRTPQSRQSLPGVFWWCARTTTHNWVAVPAARALACIGVEVRAVHVVAHACLRTLATARRSLGRRRMRDKQNVGEKRRERALEKTKRAAPFLFLGSPCCLAAAGAVDHTGAFWSLAISCAERARKSVFGSFSTARGNTY